MKVTFVLPRSDVSGGVRVVASYASRLRDRGHQVVIVSRPHRKPTVRERMRAMVHRRALPYDARKVPSLLDGTDLDHRPVDSHRPIAAGDVPDADVIIATWWETAEWVAAFPESKGAKVVFIQGYEVHEGLPADRIDATWRLPMHKIVIAGWLAKMSEERFGDSDYSLVPNSVDQAQFFAPPRDKHSTPTVGLLYSHAACKGCDIALKAIDLAAKQLPGLRLISFGGRGPTPQLPLPPTATFVQQPPQNSIRDIYASADVWLFPSRSEGFGLPILEAMACRTPVIATPAGAAPELLSGGGGMLVPLEDPPAMASAIEQVCRMVNAEWRTLSDKAHQTVARYTWDDATTLFEAALRRACEKSNARRAVCPA